MQSNSVSRVRIQPYRGNDRVHIRTILGSIGWEEHYVVAFEEAAARFARSGDAAVYLAHAPQAAIGFVFVEYRAWNRLAQIQGLAVDPAFHRQGVGATLVKRAEDFARARHARGIYVDTPATNEIGRRFYEAIGYRFGYNMPRYYEDTLDGVTYQKFFDG